MSIYATAINFDAYDHDPECAQWVEVTGGEDDSRLPMMICDGRRYLRDRERECTCRCGPIAYEGSHILPSDDDGRAGSFSACYIPGFVERTDRPPVTSDDEDYPAHPWLRIWADEGKPDHRSAVVLLDRRQVRRLHAFLGRWLEAQDDAEQE